MAFRIFSPALALAAVTACVVSTCCHGAILRGQSDTFGDGTTDNWTIGRPQEANTPVNVSTGGPLGTGDAFMKIVADGRGAGGHLVAFNRTQWTGNFTAAGVNAIEMDMKNFSSQTLVMRIAIKSDPVHSDGWATSDALAFRLANDGRWHHVVFPLTPQGLTGVGINQIPTFAAQMRNVAEMRILSHAMGPWTDGEILVASVGVDNIRAMPVPEPGGGACLAAAAGALLLRRRRRRA